MNFWRRQGQRDNLRNIGEALAKAYPPDSDADAALDRLIARLNDTDRGKGKRDAQD